MTRSAVLALLAILAGCTTSPPVTAPPSPTTSSEPPAAPSDFIPHTDLLVGTVVRGGDGPCYGLRTDDGTEYALHSTEGFDLPYGKRVKLRTESLHYRIDCGPGRPLGITGVESVD
jgi:hypothetical protein